MRRASWWPAICGWSSRSRAAIGGYGFPLGELVAEGNLGLVQALGKFDPERGFRFATYAMWWIKAAIQEHILHNWSMVKLGTTAAQKKLFFNLRRLKSRLGETGGGDLPPEAVASIARDLAVETSEVIEMNRRLAGGDASLNVRIGEDGEREWGDMLVDERQDQEGQVARGQRARLAARSAGRGHGRAQPARAAHPDRAASSRTSRRRSRSWRRSTACRASASGRSRCARSSASSRRCCRPRTASAAPRRSRLDLGLAVHMRLRAGTLDR